MKLDRGWLSTFASWVIVLCAVLTSMLVLRREFLHDSSVTSVTSVTSEDPTPQAMFLNDSVWQETLASGIQSGAADAPVQVVEFADFQCSFCASYETTIRTIRDRYPEEITFALVHYPLPQHELAEPAARAAECAHAQGKFERMRSILFERQISFNVDSWRELARSAGVVDLEQFDLCVSDTETAKRIEKTRALGDRIGVRGTPTIIINGWKFPSPPSAEDYDRIFENVMNGRPAAAGINFGRAGF